MDEFKAWLRSRGFWWDEEAIELGCSIEDARGVTRVGVRARRRLEVGEVVVRIPSSGCLTCSDCTHNASVVELQKSLGEKEWLAALGFALMLERGRGRVGGGASTSSPSQSWSSPSPSPWQPYLASLPASEPGVVMMWPDERRRYLAGTEVEQALRDERAQARMEWDGHVKTIVAKLDAADAAAAADADVDAAEKGSPGVREYTFDDYLAARSVVSSRAFTINPVVGVGLVPIADLFNHRTGGHHVHLTDLDEEDKVKLKDKLDGGGVGVGGKHEGECMFMKVVKALDAGEEMFNTYGELGNAKLLCSYGFAQVDNPADHVTIGVPALRAAAALRGVSGARIAARLAWCEANGVCDDETRFHLRAHSVPPDALLLVLWVLATSDGRFDAVRNAAKPSVDKQGTSETVVAHFIAIAEKQQGGLKEESALQILFEALHRRRALYIKDVPEDGGSEWESNVSILLSAEKDILQSCCEKYLESASENNMQSSTESFIKKKRRCDELANDDAFSLFD